jgi:branched-chain amino acid transport system ATP-binding protein
VLQVERMEAAYGAVRALWGIDVTVDRGDLVALIGANGAGKSTFLNACMGLVSVKSGSVRYNDRDITNASTHSIVRGGMTLVPEGRRVFPDLTIDENLRVATYGNSDSATFADIQAHVFELFPRLAERRGQQAGTLSGGEQQMLAIGRALMSNPRLLLLDEPSLGLAPVVQDQVFERIQTINREGTTVLLVEQNAFLALEVANRGVVLQTGRVVLSGTASELLQSEVVRQSYLGGTVQAPDVPA